MKNNLLKNYITAVLTAFCSLSPFFTWLAIEPTIVKNINSVGYFASDALNFSSLFYSFSSVFSEIFSKMSIGDGKFNVFEIKTMLSELSNALAYTSIVFKSVSETVAELNAFTSYIAIFVAIVFIGGGIATFYAFLGKKFIFPILPVALSVCAVFCFVFVTKVNAELEFTLFVTSNFSNFVVILSWVLFFIGLSNPKTSPINSPVPKTPPPVNNPIKPISKQNTANFCKKCGNKLNPTSKFCSKCGNKL